MSDDGWIAVGVAVLFSTVGVDSLTGSNEATLTVLFVGAGILFRAISRPVGDSFIPKGGWLFWIGFALAVAGVAAAIWLQSGRWLCVFFGASAISVTASHLLSKR